MNSTTYNSRGGTSVRKSKSRSCRAGLLFPVGRIHRVCRKDPWVGYRIGKGAPVYLAAVLEYLVAEVTEQAGLVARLGGKDRIVPMHIKMAVRRDEELDLLFAGVIMQGVGTMETMDTLVLEKADMAGDLRLSIPISRKKEQSKLRRNKTAKNKTVLKRMNVSDRRPGMSVDLKRTDNIEFDLVTNLTGEGQKGGFEKDMLGIENTHATKQRKTHEQEEVYKMSLDKEHDEKCRDKENNNCSDKDLNKRQKSRNRDNLKVHSFETEMSRIGQNLEKEYEKILIKDIKKKGVKSKREKFNTDKSHGIVQDKYGRGKFQDRTDKCDMDNVINGNKSDLKANRFKRSSSDASDLDRVKYKKGNSGQFLEIQNQDDLIHVQEFVKFMKGVRKVERNKYFSRSPGI